jgi:hypothetical protein
VGREGLVVCWVVSFAKDPARDPGDG